MRSNFLWSVLEIRIFTSKSSNVACAKCWFIWPRGKSHPFVQILQLLNGLQSVWRLKYARQNYLTHCILGSWQLVDCSQRTPTWNHWPCYAWTNSPENTLPCNADAGPWTNCTQGTDEGYVHHPILEACYDWDCGTSPRRIDYGCSWVSDKYPVSFTLTSICTFIAAADLTIILVTCG